MVVPDQARSVPRFAEVRDCSFPFGRDLSLTMSRLSANISTVDFDANDRGPLGNYPVGMIPDTCQPVTRADVREGDLNEAARGADASRARTKGRC